MTTSKSPDAENPSLNVLHIAAFGGNLGDYINHNNFRDWFAAHFKERHLHWQQLDLRQIWRGDRDLELAVKNVDPKPDLIVIGGGNFWETWDSTSKSGTSINMTAEEFKQLGIPVFFNSLGVETARGVSSNAREHFLADLTTYMNSSQFFTTVRNDGATKNLRALGFIDERLMVLPDHGFFVRKREPLSREVSNGFTILINLAEDIPELRYQGFQDEQEFLRGFAGMLERICFDESVHLHFEAHVPGDLSMGQRLMNMLPDKIRRDSFSLRYARHDESSISAVLDEYQQADLVLSQRFHATILGLRLSRDVVSISNHPQVIDMLTETDAPLTASLPVSFSRDFFELEGRILASIAGECRAGGLLDVTHMLSQRAEASKQLEGWLRGHGFITSLR